MREVLVVELRESLPVVDGFTDYEHGGEGEMIVVNHLGEVLQLAAINLLVGPGEVVASRHRSVLGILLEQLALYVIDY